MTKVRFVEEVEVVVVGVNRIIHVGWIVVQGEEVHHVVATTATGILIIILPGGNYLDVGIKIRIIYRGEGAVLKIGLGLGHQLLRIGHVLHLALGHVPAQDHPSVAAVIRVIIREYKSVENGNYY